MVKRKSILWLYSLVIMTILVGAMSVVNPELGTTNYDKLVTYAGSAKYTIISNRLIEFSDGTNSTHLKLEFDDSIVMCNIAGGVHSDAELKSVTENCLIAYISKKDISPGGLKSTDNYNGLVGKVGTVQDLK